jgi:hypothetical protein
MPHLVPICFSGSKRARWDACGQGEENAMAKYDLLREHLMRQTHREFDLTFRQIEDIIGAFLPRGAGLPDWWTNLRGISTHVQREAWRAAGYDAFLIKGVSRVKFRRVS